MGKYRIVASSSIAANSEGEQRALPATNIVSMCPTQCLHGSCTVAHDRTLTSIAVRFDLNGILDGTFVYDVLEDVVLKPVLRFMHQPLLDKQVFDMAGMTWADVSPPGHADVGAAVDKIHRQKRTLLLHCLEGVNRTGFIFAMIFISYYHESSVTAEQAMRHVCALRPSCEFRKRRDAQNAQSDNPKDHRGLGRPAERCWPAWCSRSQPSRCSSQSAESADPARRCQPTGRASGTSGASGASR